ncbi:hypothetical protein TSUD_162610 [Trifolium subterraneum]|uniref:Uncharacterized protein n=1 Tax=Trifolium subterraneum TaxID=3900 RepID=A0A2Z6MRU1_TRISU|nr:hypothetical protein TSUD_162610 [Trifolium subterraneum]
MGRLCQHLKLNIDDTEKLRSFNCGDKGCTRSMKRTCMCCKNKHESWYTINWTKRGFVPKTANFTVSDDLNVKPDNSSSSSVSLPKYLGCGDIDTIKIVTVEVTRKEILDLVMCSLFSETPLSNVFLSNTLEIQYAKPTNVLDLGDDNTGARLVRKTVVAGDSKIEVKAMVRKSDNKILYVLGEEDFADLLLSFLTFPLGGIENMLNGNSGLDNIDNLFKSMVDLDPHSYMKDPSTYMVTDELVITPGSSISSISFLNERKIRLSDLEERALCLLKASLISKSALTDGLGPFLANKDQKISN